MFEYFFEFPFSMLDRFEELTGCSLGQEFLIINYQYGENFSGPGKFPSGLQVVTCGLKILF